MSDTKVTNVFSARTADVRSIGKGIRLTDSRAAEVVATLPDDFNAKTAGAVTGAVHAWATGCVCPSGRGKTCQCGNRPAVKTGGKATDYGTGVDTLTTAVKRLLSGDDVKPIRLTVSLSGEGGGSTVVPADHPLYATLVALLASAEG